ncbi:hypothetical protein CPB86DRAFT_766635 [Serendipita vermifera]|nr:hypothetical protein CPB86DRAFT_766635 [Serendipita vermifera]
MDKPTDKETSISSDIDDPEYERGPPRQHHRFFLEGGDILLRVNNALFRVHRFFLVEHSVVLHDMLELPSPSNNTKATSLARTDITMSGDSVVAWERLLEIFYHKDVFKTPRYSAEDWAAVLMLAHKYIMVEIELGALKRLKIARPPLDMVTMMQVAQKVDSQELYHIALNQLARKDDVISLEDANRVGIKALHDIFSMYVVLKAASK